MGADNFTQRLRTIIFSNIGKPADAAVRTLNKHFAGKGCKQQPLGGHVECHQNNAIRVAEVFRVALPVVHTGHQVMILPLTRLRHTCVIQRINLARLGRKGGAAAAKKQQRRRQAAKQAFQHVPLLPSKKPCIPARAPIYKVYDIQLKNPAFWANLLRLYEAFTRSAFPLVYCCA